MPCIGNPRTDWLYSTDPDPGLNGRSLRYPRGKVLGGSSSINGMIYMRGQARDYDGLAAGDGFGVNPDWNWTMDIEVDFPSEPSKSLDWKVRLANTKTASQTLGIEHSGGGLGVTKTPVARVRRYRLLLDGNRGTRLRVFHRG